MSAPTRAEAPVAILLAAAAGAVDAASILVLHELFTANMTGNTTHLGVSLGHGNLASALPLAVAALVFVLAIGVGTVVVRLSGLAAPTLAAEAALLAVFMVYGNGVLRHGQVPDHHLAGFYTLATVAIVAMGLQTATVTRVGETSVHTTYISGMLTHVAQETVAVVLGTAPRPAAARRAALYLGLFLGFLAGGAWGGFAERRWQLWSLAFPLGAVLLTAAADLRRGPA